MRLFVLSSQLLVAVVCTMAVSLAIQAFAPSVGPVTDTLMRGLFLVVTLRLVMGVGLRGLIRARKRRWQRLTPLDLIQPELAPGDLLDQLFAPLVERGDVDHIVAALITPRQPVAFFPSADKGRETRLYEIGSLTKTMTGELLASMIVDGTASLSTTIGEVLHDWSLPPTIAAITLQQLVTHQSGLPRLPRSLALGTATRFTSDPYRWLSLAAFRRALARDRRKTPLATYSNFGFAVLGQVLGRLHRSDYRRALHDRVLQPLGLRNTFVDPTDEIATRLVRGHDLTGIPTPRWHTGVVAPAGGVSMTIADGARWLAAHIQPPRGFSRISVMATQPLAPFGAHQIGMGWIISDRGSRSVAWHNGATGGFSSFTAFDAVQGCGIIVFAATQCPGVLDRAGISVMRALGNRP